jgi:hypothetical protein
VFWGLTAEQWTALATVLMSAATFVLVVVGVYQIISIREEAKRTRTLSACDRYDTDPVIDRSLRNLATARADGSLENTPRLYKSDITTVLNYFDSVAIGIEQGLYIDALARDHIEGILKTHFNQYLGPSFRKETEINQEHFQRLNLLYQRWSHDPPRFGKGWWFNRRKP